MTTATNIIPLFYGTSVSFDENEHTPLMTLTPSDDTEREFSIEFGQKTIGILTQGEDNSYDLSWLLTGGCFSGRGKADITTDVGRASIAAHIFELLAHDLRTYIEESSEATESPLLTPEVGKTYRVVSSRTNGAVGSTLKIVSAGEHEFMCEGEGNEGAFGIEDFRSQLADGIFVEIK